MAIVSLDAEKAFDSVQLPWLYQVLGKMGFEGNMVSFLHMLYKTTTTRILTTGALSAPIPQQRGTRQGCPLSPLLFNIAMEPLSLLLQQTQKLHGIKVGSGEIRSALYADDILLFTSSPHTDLPYIQETFDKFKEVSGLQIDYTKSEILPLPTTTKRTWTQQTIFHIALTSIKYLGIHIGKTPSSLYNLNYKHLIDSIITQVNSWRDLPLSLLGRCHLLKMISFARLLYPIQTLVHTILLKHNDIQRLNREFSKFIWRGQKPRIALTKLQRKTNEGGLGLPNLRLYNLAALLRHAMDWITGDSTYSNTLMEQAGATPWKLESLLHTKISKLPDNIRLNLVYRDTILTWRETLKLLGRQHFFTKFTPIQGNPRKEQTQRLLEGGIGQV